MSGTLRKYKINAENILETTNEQISIKKETKKAIMGRPKKKETCNKRVIMYFTQHEFDDIAQKAGSFPVASFLKRIIMDNL